MGAKEVIKMNHEQKMSIFYRVKEIDNAIVSDEIELKRFNNIVSTVIENLTKYKSILH